MKKHKILLVDDEYAHRVLVERALSEYQILTAQSGREMWEILEKERPELILLDVLIPDEDGFQIAYNLLNNEQTREIPILFLSARVTGDDVSQGLDSGGYDYVKKPFDPTELRARLKAVLRKKQLEMELKQQSMIDPLTNTFNRHYFMNAISKQLAYITRNKKTMSIAMLDLDHLEQINTEHGHQSGDFILKIFADTLKESIRRYDIMARYGGEEFAVMFFECDKETSKIVLNRIKEGIENSRYSFGESLLTFTFSGGVAESRELTTTDIRLEQLIALAEERLLKAKHSGRNTIVTE